MKVKDVMNFALIEVSSGDSCQRAAELMRDHGVGMLVVTKEGRIIEGVITDRDLVVRCMALGGDPAMRPVGVCMELHPTTVDGGVDLEKAVEMMRNADIRRMPVTISGARVIGVLSLDDVAHDVKQYLDAFLAVAGHHSQKGQ